MINNKLKIAIVAGIAIVVILIILKLNNDPYRILGKKAYSGLDKTYLKARAKAVRRNEEIFKVAGKQYLTETGKAI